MLFVVNSIFHVIKKIIQRRAIQAYIDRQELVNVLSNFIELFKTQIM